MTARHWYAGIVLVVVALIAQALLGRPVTRYHCESISGDSVSVVCVDERTGDAEIVGLSQGRLVSIRWQIGRSDSATRHNMPVTEP